MTIRYDLNRRDLIRANIHILLRNKFLYVMWTVVVFFVCSSAMAEPQNSERELGYKIIFCVIMGGLYLSMFFIGTFLVTTITLLVRTNKGVLGSHSLTLTPEGIIEETEHNRSFNRWSAYHRTIRGKNFLMLYVAEGQFHFIRKSALFEGDIVAFETQLSEYTKGA